MEYRQLTCYHHVVPKHTLLERGIKCHIAPCKDTRYTTQATFSTENARCQAFIVNMYCKLQKQREIEKYESQLKIIEEKLFFLRKEKEITERALANAPEDPVYEDALAFLQDAKGRWFSAKDIAIGALKKDETWCDRRNLNAVARSLERTRHNGVVMERRKHTPENAAYGKPGTKKCWMMPDH